MVHQLEIAELYGQLSSYFIQNEGQLADERVYYYAEGSGYGIYFTDEGVLFVWNRTEGDQTESLRLDYCFLNKGEKVMPKGRSSLVGKMNYFSGNGIQQQHTNVSTYEEIVYKDVWAGIDLVFKIEQGKMKYEFLLQPYVDVATIRFTYKGVNGLSVDADGNLVLDTPFGEIIDTHPISYHVQEDKQVKVESAFQLVEEDTVISFRVGDGYDECLPLVIDPEVVYSTLLLSGEHDNYPTIAIDKEGCAYIVGMAPKWVIPVTSGAYQYNLEGYYNIFLSKLNSTGSALVYSATLGDPLIHHDSRMQVVVDDEGCAYVSGRADPGNYPTTPGAYQMTSDWLGVPFITKLNPSGSGLIYSTFLSGKESSGGLGGTYGIDIDSEGNAYVVGYTFTADFPTTPGAYSEVYGPSDSWVGFISKIDAAGEELLYSTFFTGPHMFSGIKVYEDGTVYVGGVTQSNYFITTDDAYIKQKIEWGEQGFVTKFNETLSKMVYSTFISTSRTYSSGIAIDGEGCAYITGTEDDDNAFVAKLNEAGTDMVYFENLGTVFIARQMQNGIAVDSYGNAYVIGVTMEDDFPTTSDAFQPTKIAMMSGYITKLDPTGEKVLYSTYFGGENGDTVMIEIVVDDQENLYIVGVTRVAETFPTTPNAFRSTLYYGSPMSFVTKIATGPARKLKRLGFSHDAFSETIIIQDSMPYVPIWQNQTGYMINGTIVVENKGEIDDWTVQLLMNEFIGGQEKIIEIKPGEMQAITVNNLMTITLRGTEVGLNETIVEVSYSLNW